MKKEYKSVYRGEEVDEAVRRVYALADYEEDPNVAPWAKTDKYWEEPEEIGVQRTKAIWDNAFSNNS